MRENERSRLHIPQKPGTTQSGVCETQSKSAVVDTLEREPGNPGARTSPSDTECRLERLQTAEIMSLLRRQNFRCALTGDRLTPENAALDHIKPICRGGNHDIENMQALTDAANRAKGSLTQDEFIQLCSNVVTWSDQGLSDDV